MVFEARTRGVRLTSEALDYLTFDGSVTSEIAAESTRWRGRNSGGYSNLTYDRLYKDLYNTVDLGQQYQIAADMVKFQLDNALYLPLVYSPSVSANRPLVRGITMTGVKMYLIPQNMSFIGSRNRFTAEANVSHLRFG